MDFHVLTLFPEMIKQAFGTSITGRAEENGHIALHTVNIRDYTQDRHRKVDDYPYGGGAGMLMQAQPVYDSFVAARERIMERRRRMGGPKKNSQIRTIYVTPQGRTFTQELAEEFAAEEDLIILCGHYEGIDERVLQEIVTDYISIGDYILTGGELPAMVLMDAVARLVPQVLHNGESAEVESFHNHLLEYPQYSRPETWKDISVPKVLLSGDHKKIENWRQEQSLFRTKERRPDLYEKYRQEQNTIERLLQNKLLHMGMIEPMRRGSAKLLYVQDGSVLILEKRSGVYLITAEAESSVNQMLQALQQDIQYRGIEQPGLIACKEWLLPYLEQAIGLKAGRELRQAVYTRGVPFPPAKEIKIRQLDRTCFSSCSNICDSGSMITAPEYLNKRLLAGSVYGSYKEEELTGFIVLHEDGSIGMPYVSKNHRRKGIATALEAACINRRLRAGRIPYCRIPAEEEPLFRLQEKLGLRIAGTCEWLCL